METENKDWKPEVGKTAWTVRTEDGSFSSEVYEVVVKFLDRHSEDFVWCLSHGWGTSSYRKASLFPTPEAALASIKIYDLEGKEVVIPRAQDKIIDEMCARAFEQIAYLSDWDDADYARLGMAPIINAFKEIIAVKDKAVIKRLIDVAYKMELPPNPDGEARLKAAQERFKSANGGKSDAREGGC